MTRFSIQRHYATMQPLIQLGQEIRERGHLDGKLVELVLMRCSQINGCAFCLDMHSKDARAAGETEQRLYLLPAWRETTLYSESEQAALALAEELTELPSHESVSDALYERLRQHFEEAAVVDLVLLIGMINTWNRLNIAARTVGGSYKPAARH
ncbi:carboxymuconolactone decarboxylase family protein [Rhodanobacter sp. DHG33]|uniref:carboxymuconolactone decarboxylase family protein n=1 Tax=Rhodanobacter sp. DHG33 TaxID=2775921 RepID=UPI00177F51B7|nr:carboxymuconolactone decarboxylase family protein [Rhodanobacter sp. DHG33]MBD8898009.1 carboxymuconolactone decarboxylase family protein [Rhodanobacter sp. DHG33]